MARMLQALKNLEARSPRPTVQRLKDAEANPSKKEPASTTPVAEPPAAKVEPPPTPPAAKKEEPVPAPPPPTVNDNEPLSEVLPTALVRPMRRADAPPATSPVTSLTQSLVLTAPVRWAANPKGESSPTSPPRKSNANCRPPSGFERVVRRTLGDRVRSQPLVQLADRLQRDIEQSASKTLVLVGVGPTSKTHETLLYAATLLAEKLPGELVLVDADLGRQPLSTALEYGQEQGLA